MNGIGIDIGTTSISGAVIDCDTKKVLRTKSVSSNAFLQRKREYEREQNVEKIIGIAFEILHELMDDDTSSVGVTGQMHGILYYDKLGNAVSNLFTWQDLRGEEKYGDGTYSSFLHSYTGYGNVTDFYNRQNGLVPEAAVGFCTVQDYFVMKLCGLKKAVIHRTNAASLGCYDIENNTFLYDNGITPSEGDAVAGYYSKVPVGVAIGDNQASVYSFGIGRGDLLLNLGTGGQVSAVSERAVVADNIETRPYFDGKYLIVGSSICGGRAYAVLNDFFRSVLGKAVSVGRDEMYKYMEEWLEATAQTSLCCNTEFSGTRADASKRGSISELSTENFTPGDLTLGVLTGMIRELYLMYCSFGGKCTRILASGNAVRLNPRVLQIIEEIFAIKPELTDSAEEAAAGAALYGMKVSDIHTP